jgi:hypothetical protein
MLGFAAPPVVEFTFNLTRLPSAVATKMNGVGFVGLGGVGDPPTPVPPVPPLLGLFRELFPHAVKNSTRPKMIKLVKALIERDLLM